MGSSKTVYSIFSKTNEKFITNVLLMNNTTRGVPSIISYTPEHRLIGENTKSVIKKNIDTSFNNLSRLLLFEKNFKFTNELKFMYTNENDINNFDFKCYNEKGEKIIIKSEYIIADYLSFLNEYYFEKEKIDYSIIYLSLPDFYNKEKKKKLKLICEAIGMEDVTIVDESLAITMYYGYNKYSDLFFGEKTINENIEKNILFVDIGYSKTSFILSKFKYDEFCVLQIEYEPNLGGRDFDYELYEYCIEEFKKENPNLIVNQRMKYKLIEEISIKRKNLTVNNEITINVSSFYENNDLIIKITKENFEKLNQKHILTINSIFEKILNDSKENNINIDYVEIAGELMRTPILQKMIKDKNLKISKTILIDECTSVGAALLGNFFNGNFPISYLKKVYNCNKKENLNENYENYNDDDIIFKEEIAIHDEMQQKIDLKYDFFISKKTELLKLINKFKEKADENEIIEIKKLGKIEINENSFNEIFNSLEKKLEMMKNKDDLKELIQSYKKKINDIEVLMNNNNEKMKFKFNKKKIIREIEKINLKIENYLSNNIFNDILFFDIELNGIINIDEIEKWKNNIKNDKINDERQFSKEILKFFNQNIKELSQIDSISKNLSKLFDSRKEMFKNVNENIDKKTIEVTNILFNIENENH